MRNVALQATTVFENLVLLKPMLVPLSSYNDGDCCESVLLHCTVPLAPTTPPPHAASRYSCCSWLNHYNDHNAFSCSFYLQRRLQLLLRRPPTPTTTSTHQHHHHHHDYGKTATTITTTAAATVTASATYCYCHHDSYHDCDCYRHRHCHCHYGCYC